MYGYSKLRELDSFQHGAGDTIWRNPSKLLDRIIIAKAAYPTLSNLGDRVPLLMPDEDEIREAEQELAAVRIQMKNVNRQLKKVKSEMRLAKPDQEARITSPQIYQEASQCSAKSTGSKIAKRIRRIFSRIF